MDAVPVVVPSSVGEPRAAPDGIGLLDPVVGVDLRRPGGAVPVPADDRILVGIGPVHPDHAAVPQRLDTTLVPGPPRGPQEVRVADPEESLQRIGEVVHASPQAARVLTGLLRWNGLLPVEAALDAESTAYSTLLGGLEFARWLAARGDRPLPEPVDDPVLVERAGGVLRVTLHRPERRNAYGALLRDALVDALDVAVCDPSVARLVLDGAGPSFCSGGDLDEFGTTPDPVTAHLVRTRAGAGRRIHALRERTTVHLHGPCIGAGIELAAFAGRVVADPGTTVRLPEIGMGLIPGAGGTVGIPRRIGRWRTLYTALSATTLDAGTALAWGLVDHVDQDGPAGERRADKG